MAVVVAQVVAQRTTDREVPSSISAGSSAFFFSSLSYFNQSVVRGPWWRCNTADYQLSNKNKGLAQNEQKNPWKGNVELSVWYR